MNDADYNRLMAGGAPRRLSDEQRFALEAYLATRPHLRAVWEEDEALSRLLGQLPDAPIASNFTARVMQSVTQAARPATPQRAGWWTAVSSLRWVRPSMAMGALAAVCALSVYQYRTATRADYAQSIRQFSHAPSIEMLRDFEAITRLSQATHFVDEDLLAAPE